MKLLITGAGGQLGQTLSQMASNQYDVIAYDRHSLDITDAKAVEGVITEIKPDCVVNAAAYTAVDKAETEKEQALAINRDGSANLAKVCAEQNIPLIHISTDYVFNGDKKTPYNEADDADPINVYGESKWAGEEAVRKTHAAHIILRVSWVFGFYGNNFVKTIQRLARERNELRVVADQQGCPTSTENISNVLLRIIEQVKQPGFEEFGTYHYCDAPDSNWHEFASAIVAETKKYETLAVENIQAITTEEFPTPAKRQSNSRMDCSKLKQVFGIERYSWQDALKKLVKELSEK